MKSKISKIIHTAGDIINLPKVEIAFETQSKEGASFYNYLTKRHPRYLIFKNKSIGVALIDLTKFSKPDEYLQSVNGKNSAYYFSRKATRANYLFREIDPNEWIDAIFEINNSMDERQGREMGESYTRKINDYPRSEHYRYFGVFKENMLVAYNWMYIFGEVAIISRLLGHGDFLKDGIMYLLITGTVSILVESNNGVKYVMYDTLLGASEGLKLFKERLGFKPYHVKWKAS